MIDKGFYQVAVYGHAGNQRAFEPIAIGYFVTVHAVFATGAEISGSYLIGGHG
jgi:hypothetical protein